VHKHNTPHYNMTKTIFSAPKTLILVILVLMQFYCKAQSTPLPNGFAHNDYRHKRPLLDALENGFTNIEADIFLRDTTLIVAHALPQFKSRARNLERLYLKPLHDRILANNGRVYANYNKPVILMIDIKTGSDDTYRALARMLDKYRDMLTSYDNGEMHYGAITVVLSGHKPYKMLEAQDTRFAFIDEDLRKVARDSSSATNDVFTMASCKYSNMLKWGGKGPMPLLQRERLCRFVDMAHRLGSKVRLWASPDRRAVWDELLKCGVDLINTDHLVPLKNYLSKNQVTLAKADL
jgi:hypothetical protein